ncbi:hypothetical protein ABH935_002631 [Catenulispora sp. GAS73]|uniref:hypothetical protein n=1 Tax=Catenulispora sp. GAS73 TaxID=3156269 RepID=UPI0035143C66
MTDGAVTGTPDASDWQQVLSDGFGAFLGRPLDEHGPEAVYGAYYWAGNFLADVGFADDAAWVDPEALAGRLTVTNEDIVMYDEGEVAPCFDAATSIFVFEDESALPAAFAADLSAAAFPSSEPDSRLILGRDLGALLARHDEVDLTDEVAAGTWHVLYPRIASDGTLRDALRAATSIGDGPDSLIEFHGKPEERWQAALSRVAHPGLRAHLSFACQEIGAASLHYVGEDDLTFWGLTGEGCSVVAAWDETENQVEVAVFQLAGALLAKG